MNQDKDAEVVSRPSRQMRNLIKDPVPKKRFQAWRSSHPDRMLKIPGADLIVPNPLDYSDFTNGDFRHMGRRYTPED